jgi:hypothetical protein
MKKSRYIIWEMVASKGFISHFPKILITSPHRWGALKISTKLKARCCICVISCRSEINTHSLSHAYRSGLPVSGHCSGTSLCTLSIRKSLHNKLCSFLTVRTSANKEKSRIINLWSIHNLFQIQDNWWTFWTRSLFRLILYRVIPFGSTRRLIDGASGNWATRYIIDSGSC